jgi:hypothetical protein
MQINLFDGNSGSYTCSHLLANVRNWCVKKHVFQVNLGAGSGSGRLLSINAHPDHEIGASFLYLWLPWAVDLRYPAHRYHAVPSPGFKSITGWESDILNIRPFSEWWEFSLLMVYERMRLSPVTCVNVMVTWRNCLGRRQVMNCICMRRVIFFWL